MSATQPWAAAPSPPSEPRPPKSAYPTLHSIFTSRAPHERLGFSPDPTTRARRRVRFSLGPSPRLVARGTSGRAALSGRERAPAALVASWVVSVPQSEELCANVGGRARGAGQGRRSGAVGGGLSRSRGALRYHEGERCRHRPGRAEFGGCGRPCWRRLELSE